MIIFGSDVILKIFFYRRKVQLKRHDLGAHRTDAVHRELF